MCCTLFSSTSIDARKCTVNQTLFSALHQLFQTLQIAEVSAKHLNLKSKMVPSKKNKNVQNPNIEALAIDLHHFYLP
jgi:hypothetical protein